MNAVLPLTDLMEDDVSGDFTVMQVVKDQIMRALNTKPNSLDQFKSKLQNLSYTEILKIRQSERMNQEEFQSRPILELREKIQPEIMELIKQQRLNRLCEGTCFRKISSRRRQGSSVGNVTESVKADSTVMQVVKDQIMRALNTKPNSLDQFKSKLQNLSYTEILKIRQSERMNQEDFQSRPILELREKILPEIMELIKQQRLNRLCEGTCFRKISSRRRQDKFWYCRLSPNHKVLHYGDLEENPQGEVPHDSLQEKCDAKLLAIALCITVEECREVLELAFSVLYESDEYLNFIAPDKHEYSVWTDGLNALLGKEMASDLTKSDLDTLLSMEMKLRLLDLENIQIPEVPPPIPKEPSNYDFVYNYK
ncbi:UNVERIFIED_CONTAM: hypothetical protein FKN15_000687 [Acipenser sinensis]